MLKTTFQFLVYSNLYVGLALGLYTFHGFANHLELQAEYSLLIASSSSFLYSFHALFGLRYIPDEQRSHRHRWLSRNQSYLWAFTVLIGLVSAFQIWRIPNVILILLPAFGLTALYVLPILGKRLRDLNYTKVILVSLVVVYMCRYVPLYLNGQVIPSPFVLLELILCTAFIFLLTLPFDLRDREVEKSLKTRILIYASDAKQSFRLVFMGLGLCMIGILLLGFQSPSSLQWRLSEFAALSFTFFALAVPATNRNELFYPLFFEGPLLLMGLFSLFLAI